MRKLKALIAIAIVGLMFTQQSFAALGAATIWEWNFGATSGNVNGGGFNMASSGLPTDLACTSGNTSTPDCTSATIGTWSNAVNGAWVWVHGTSGANWNINGANDGTTTGGGCFFPITANSTTHITINAAVGAGNCLRSGTAPAAQNGWATNTVAGIGVASPSSGTFGIDLSRSTGPALDSGADLGSTAGAPTTLTSTTQFYPEMVHNLVHIRTTGTGAHCVVGWYEITAYTTTSAVTTDRTTNDGTACVAGTGNVGGALGMASVLDADWFAVMVAGNKTFVKYNASPYTFGEAPAMTNDCTEALACGIEGYNAVRGDAPTTTSRPTLNPGATAFSIAGDYMRWTNLIFTTTHVNGITLGQFPVLNNIKVTNTANSATALTTGTAAQIYNTEATATGTSAVALATTNTATDAALIVGSYIHDSVTCLSLRGGNTTVMFNVIDNCSTAGIALTAGRDYNRILYNTLYGAATPAGTAINGTDNAVMTIYGNIIYGWTSGLVLTSETFSNHADYNDFYNNTTNRSNVAVGKNDLAVDPQFTDGPGANFKIGNSSLKGTGFPGSIPGSATTGYASFGAAQVQATGGGVGGGGFVQ